jgi:hypothetical protein
MLLTLKMREMAAERCRKMMIARMKKKEDRRDKNYTVS